MVRVKRRYILAHVRENFPAQDSFNREFKDKFYEFFGDFGIACLNRCYSIKRYNPKDHTIIMVLRKGVHQMALSILPSITKIDGDGCNVRILHLSGTLRKCLEKIKTRNIMSLRASIGKQLEREKNKQQPGD